MDAARHQPPISSPDFMRQRLAIGALISRLMSHYWTADDPPEVRRAQAEDWLDDLVEFGAEIVVAACAEWRHRPGGKRPTPGDIRALCIEGCELRRQDATLALPSPDQRERIAEQREDMQWMRRAKDEEDRQYREAWARQLGYESFATMLRIGLVHATRDAPAYRGVSQLSGPNAAALGVTATESVA